MLLYVHIERSFSNPIVPFYKAQACSVTLFRLTSDPAPKISSINEGTPKKMGKEENGVSSSSSNTAKAIDYMGNKQGVNSDVAKNALNSDGGKNAAKYYIWSEEDLYHTSEWMRLVLPWNIGGLSMITFQLFVTMLCVIGAVLGRPMTWMLENAFGGNMERLQRGDVGGHID